MGGQDKNSRLSIRTHEFYGRRIGMPFRGRSIEEVKRSPKVSLTHHQRETLHPNLFFFFFFLKKKNYKTNLSQDCIQSHQQSIIHLANNN